MQNTKQFEQSLSHYIELQKSNQTQLTQFSPKTSPVSVGVWEKLVSQIKQKLSNGMMPDEKREMSKKLPLLIALVENEESIRHMLMDIKQIHTYQKQLIEWMHQIIEQNNEKAYELYEGLKSTDFELGPQISPPVKTIAQFYAEFV